jgi:hypothetical protein
MRGPSTPRAAALISLCSEAPRRRPVREAIISATPSATRGWHLANTSPRSRPPGASRASPPAGRSDHAPIIKAPRRAGQFPPPRCSGLDLRIEGTRLRFCLRNAPLEDADETTARPHAVRRGACARGRGGAIASRASSCALRDVRRGALAEERHAREGRATRTRRGAERRLAEALAEIARLKSLRVTCHCRALILFFHGAADEPWKDPLSELSPAIRRRREGALRRSREKMLRLRVGSRQIPQRHADRSLPSANRRCRSSPSPFVATGSASLDCPARLLPPGREGRRRAIPAPRESRRGHCADAPARARRYLPRPDRRLSTARTPSEGNLAAWIAFEARANQGTTHAHRWHLPSAPASIARYLHLDLQARRRRRAPRGVRLSRSAICAAGRAARRSPIQAGLRHAVARDHVPHEPRTA